MPRPSRESARLLDCELDALPPELRWREWMMRIETVIFASPEPVTRDQLARLVGSNCSVDLLIEDVSGELSARPYEIVAVAGGWQFRTRPRQADVLQAAFGGGTTSAAEITEVDMLVLATIAYHQPVTRGALSDMLGREVSRDVIGNLRRMGMLSAGPRAPRPGAPYTYVTTSKFLEQFGLDTLRDLPDVEALEDAGLLSDAEVAADKMPMPRYEDRADQLE